MDRLDVLLRCALDRHEPHRRPSDRLADPLGIIAVVLLVLTIRREQVRTHQPRGVSQLLDLWGSVVSASASLHTDQTWFESRQEWEHLLAAELLTHYYCTP